jgi:hypothetical protein
MFISVGEGYIHDEREYLLDTSQEICFMEISDIYEIKLTISSLSDLANKGRRGKGHGHTL